MIREMYNKFQNLCTLYAFCVSFGTSVLLHMHRSAYVRAL